MEGTEDTHAHTPPTANLLGLASLLTVILFLERGWWALHATASFQVVDNSDPEQGIALFLFSFSGSITPVREVKKGQQRWEANRPSPLSAKDIRTFQNVQQREGGQRRLTSSPPCHLRLPCISTTDVNCVTGDPFAKKRGCSLSSPAATEPIVSNARRADPWGAHITQ